MSNSYREDCLYRKAVQVGQLDQKEFSKKRKEKHPKDWYIVSYGGLFREKKPKWQIWGRYVNEETAKRVVESQSKTFYTNTFYCHVSVYKLLQEVNRQFLK